MGDSRCPRKLLKEKSATSEFSHWSSFSLSIRDGLDGGVELGFPFGNKPKQKLLKSIIKILIWKMHGFSTFPMYKRDKEMV